MTGDPATSAPTPGFKPSGPPEWLLLWTLHTPDSWARAIATELLRKAQSSPSFETRAVVGMMRSEGRLWVRLQFRGEDGEFGEEFKLTI
jgi:hypothetical protein